MKKGFTLAEIIIVLAVIGVLAAILLPVAFQAAPDENVLKFKKAYNTLGNVIRELVTSDRYYEGGDLGIRQDGKPTDESDVAGTALTTYFCDTFSEMLSVKEKNCAVANTQVGYVTTYGVASGSTEAKDLTDKAKEELDEQCAKAREGVEILTVDGISWFETNPKITFASKKSGIRIFGTADGSTIQFRDKSGFDAAYKVFCFDVDGIDPKPEAGKEDVAISEPPFGFGIRADGKILSGKRADEWALKSVQKGKGDDEETSD